MARTESTFSERVGARISPELKDHLKALVESEQFDSEADAVREALWAYVEQGKSTPTTPPQPITSPSSPAMEQDRIQWLLTVVVIMLGIVSSKILNAVQSEKVKPAALVDEAIQESIYNHHILWEKLLVGQRMAQTLHHNDDKAVG